MSNAKRFELIQIKHNAEINRITNNYHNFLIGLAVFTVIQVSILLTSAIF